MNQDLFLARDLKPTFLLMGASSLLWLVVIGTGSVGNRIGSGVLLILSVLALRRCLVRGGAGALPLLTYLAPLEPAIRQYTPSLGYLYLEYMMVAAASLSLLVRRGRLRWNTLFFGLYVVIEVIDMPRSTAGDATRGLILQSAARLGILMVAARTDMGGQGTWTVIRAYLVGSGTIATIVGYSILTGKVEWGTQANHTASANMGPNQVGLLLSFGAFAAYVAAEFSETHRVRMVALGLMGVQTLCSLMTFSRGPVYALVGSILLYAFPQMIRQPGKLVRTVLPMVLVAGIAWAAVVLTGSMILKRYEEKGFTGRDTIARGALGIFLDNPLIGIGTGNFYTESAARGVWKKGKKTGVHNEILRTLVEHGLLGGSIYALFLTSSMLQAARGVTGRQRNLCMLWFALAVFSEVYGGLKLSAQGLQLALACESFRDPRRS